LTSFVEKLESVSDDEDSRSTVNIAQIVYSIATAINNNMFVTNSSTVSYTLLCIKPSLK